MCEEESILLKLTHLAMAPKTRVKRKAMTAVLFSTSSRKKRRISLESVISLPVSNETMPRVTVLPGAEEPAALERTSITGPNIGLDGTDVAEPSSGGEGRVLLALVAWRWVLMVCALASAKKQAQLWRISLVLVARKLLLTLLFILLKGPLKKFENTLVRIGWKLWAKMKSNP